MDEQVSENLMTSQGDLDKMSKFSYLGSLRQGSLSLAANLHTCIYFRMFCLPSKGQNECKRDCFDEIACSKIVV